MSREAASIGVASHGGSAASAPSSIDGDTAFGRPGGAPASMSSIVRPLTTDSGTFSTSKLAIDRGVAMLDQQPLFLLAALARCRFVRTSANPPAIFAP